MNLLSRFSDRLDVSECINHKWLAQTPTKEILSVQTANVNPDESTECHKPEELSNEEESSTDEKDKENSSKPSDKIEKLMFNHNSPPGAKLVLEKSLSISLFPDAPTTPKVCRKMLYDDEDELKEIVKKYQTTESPPKFQPCCDQGSSTNCLLCHPQKTTSKPSSLEIDKGIIC